MALELRHLRYLLAVAEHGNFTRAAEDLHISQPTLSQQVRQLEKALGVQLLDRTGRAVRLTDAGEAYTHHARRALRDLAAAERAVHDVQDLSRGHLRLAVTPTFTAYLVGPLTAQLHTRHPGISMTVRETTQDAIENWLLADDVDLGIAFTGPHLPGITATPLFTETLTLVTGTHHADLAHRTPLPVDNLTGLQLALLTGDFATRGHIDAYFADHHVNPEITVEANSIQALTEFVQRTPTATVLPEAITHDHPALHPVPLAPPLPTRTVALLHRTDAYRTAATHAFTRVLHDYIGTRGYPPPGRK
ncbi:MULTISPECIES: transcriptional regulator CynR [Streptomycetaceae]|uniref:DNA-binding transcriptional regulator CynR n=1 Tax=Streptantibioticus cattleyicolor (strain ATCC 35852 / DSM 46488 / JCM 4925 / NBRC 14057 / NRRL 8057) TaxID=1003195 RepID=F8K416_STREN|nr:MULTISPECIES: transcriptional regulator CynR [Streptomycetaceae]AEW92554.1 DNA-binding transcriptional regulator CynR [Streptantibioticus cattleyicolor NRRL 8057 = DSM 46488]MYS57340.1 transcriptional regulator CynR [Streptomyces sp. SID5468]CCB72910.1 HTH-type transcriptional regulator cynR [Streptantibioticus cattleyicolor NRRL 8057 = DSM 46488]